MAYLFGFAWAARLVRPSQGGEWGRFWAALGCELESVAKEGTAPRSGFLVGAREAVIFGILLTLIELRGSRPICLLSESDFLPFAFLKLTPQLPYTVTP